MASDDVRREWLLSKWERFTDEELDAIAYYSSHPENLADEDAAAVLSALKEEIHGLLAQRKADAEETSDGA